MRGYLVIVVGVLCLIAWNPGFAQDEGDAAQEASELKMTTGVQSGLGLSGQFAVGGRFFLLSERGGFGTGLGISFLLADRNIFVPTLNAEVRVSGVTVFTEILGRLLFFEPLKLQAAIGVAIVNRGGRVRGRPITLSTQGPYVGMDVRYSMLPQMAIYAGGRVAFLENAIVTITGDQEVISLSTQPAIFMGLAWDF